MDGNKLFPIRLGTPWNPIKNHFENHWSNLDVLFYHSETEKLNWHILILYTGNWICLKIVGPHKDKNINVCMFECVLNVCFLIAETENPFCQSPA